jgi:hypothetical protein
MKTNKNSEFKSKVYTDRPPCADFDAPHKFEAIKSIIAKRLIEHPNAICSYSGGSDSDIMLHLIETAGRFSFAMNMLGAYGNPVTIMPETTGRAQFSPLSSGVHIGGDKVA